MIFWIFVGVWALTLVISTIFCIRRLIVDKWYPLGDQFGVMFVLTLVMISVFGVVAIFMKGANKSIVTSVSHTPLTALSNNSGVEGRYFLGSGFVDSKLTYTYVTEKDGYYTLHSVDASDSRIREGNFAPEMLTEHRVIINPTAFPFSFPDDTTYVFDVPTGTVAHSFSVDVNK